MCHSSYHTFLGFHYFKKYITTGMGMEMGNSSIRNKKGMVMTSYEWEGMGGNGNSGSCSRTLLHVKQQLYIYTQICCDEEEWHRSKRFFGPRRRPANRANGDRRRVGCDPYSSAIFVSLSKSMKLNLILSAQLLSAVYQVSGRQFTHKHGTLAFGRLYFTR